MVVMRPRSFEKFANTATVTHIVLVPLLVCSNAYGSFAQGMGSLGGPSGRGTSDPGWVRWFGTHPFASGDPDGHAAGLWNTCVWALFPAGAAGAIALAVSNRGGSGPAA